MLRCQALAWGIITLSYQWALPRWFDSLSLYSLTVPTCQVWVILPYCTHNPSCYEITSNLSHAICFFLYEFTKHLLELSYVVFCQWAAYKFSIYLFPKALLVLCFNNCLGLCENIALWFLHHTLPHQGCQFRSLSHRGCQLRFPNST